MQTRYSARVHRVNSPRVSSRSLGLAKTSDARANERTFSKRKKRNIRDFNRIVQQLQPIATITLSQKCALETDCNCPEINCSSFPRRFLPARERIHREIGATWFRHQEDEVSRGLSETQKFSLAEVSRVDTDAHSRKEITNGQRRIKAYID